MLKDCGSMLGGCPWWFLFLLPCSALCQFRFAELMDSLVEAGKGGGPIMIHCIVAATAWVLGGKQTLHEHMKHMNESLNQ